MKKGRKRNKIENMDYLLWPSDSTKDLGLIKKKIPELSALGSVHSDRLTPCEEAGTLVKERCVK